MLTGGTNRLWYSEHRSNGKRRMARVSNLYERPRGLRENDIQIENPWYAQRRAGMGQAAAIIGASVTALATIGTMWMQWDAQHRAKIQAEHEEERAAARQLAAQQAAAAEAAKQQEALNAAIAAGQLVVQPDGSLAPPGGAAGPAGAPAGADDDKGFQTWLVLLPILAGVLLGGRG
jgi:hypothetical protein